jgi:hypothetical protein
MWVRVSRPGGGQLPSPVRVASIMKTFRRSLALAGVLALGALGPGAASARAQYGFGVATPGFSFGFGRGGYGGYYGAYAPVYPPVVVAPAPVVVARPPVIVPRPYYYGGGYYGGYRPYGGYYRGYRPYHWR